MTRFSSNTKKSPFVNAFFSILLFAAVLLLFTSGIRTLSSASLREQKATLETALEESAVHCYALNGYYPENLSYILDTYHISYDKDKFFIDYQPQGQNLMPDITVLEQ